AASLCGLLVYPVPTCLEPVVVFYSLVLAQGDLIACPSSAGAGAKGGGGEVEESRAGGSSVRVARGPLAADAAAVAGLASLSMRPLGTLMKSMMEIWRWCGWTPTGILTRPNRRPADTSTVWR